MSMDGEIDSTLEHGQLFQDNRLPSELWYKIFSYPDLTYEDIQTLTLTSRQFRSIAQPSLFTSLLVEAVGIGRPSCSDIYQTEHYLTRLQHRLSFASSPAIVGAIKTINMKVDTFPEWPHADPPVIPLDTVINTLFASLSAFFNLGSLFLDRLTLDFDQVTKMSQMPNLRELHLFRCCLDPSVTAIPRIPLRRLSVILCGAEAWWMPLVHPDTCQQLQLHDIQDCSAASAALEEETRTFIVESLRLNYLLGILGREMLVTILARMPHIRSLTFCDTVEDEGCLRARLGPLPHELLPQLSSITSSVDNLALLPRSVDRSIRRLVTTFSSLSSKYNLGEAIVWYCERFSQLEFLSIHGPEDFWQHSVLTTSPFSNLTQLKVFHLLPSYLGEACAIPVCFPLKLN